MKRNENLRRALALLLAVAMLAAFALPAVAVEADSGLKFEIEQIDNSTVTAPLPMEQMESADPQTDDPNEMVRVSIQLEKAAAMDAGFVLADIGSNARAVSYREKLQAEQEKLQTAIERNVLGGQKLDVVWNLTLAANIISVNVPRSAIAGIARLDGVKAVVEETRYQPDVVSVGGTYDPNMAVAGQMTGAAQAWQSGYTGAGTRIAVIDTGLDTDHQSFSADAFDYAIAQAAQASGIDYADALLDPEEIAGVLTQLNAYRRQAEAGVTLTAEELYINSKAAFGYNYIDGNLDVTHDNDSMGEHGSHVAGIAAANRYLVSGEGYADALDTVHVAGNAPDAQILTMKVFGYEGGAYDSDIMAAIEDALVLGADAVNLSLGSSVAGRTYCGETIYQELFDRLVETDTVVSISAGNSGYWAENTYHGYPFSDDVNFATGGSPGTYTNSLAVASVDNDGAISGGLKVGGRTMGYTESTDDGYAAFGNAALDTLDTSADATGTDYGFVFIDGMGNTADFEGIDLNGKVVFLSRGELSFVEKANNAASLGAAAVVIYNNQPGGALNMDLTGYGYTVPVVSLTQADGQAVRAAAAAQSTGAGLAYFTGTVTVVGSVSGHYNDSEFKTMSSFSSWGIPSDLTMKPEITAPGGSIYSVNGLDTSGTAYELMSGTSMAAPQVAGMSALLLQYLEENGLEADGMTARGLAQTLLMSTAEPLRSSENGLYYAVMQQGAGLANVTSAMNTPVYLTVDGMDDGKVKVELGDDADRTGTYTFRFMLNNLTDATVAYQLSADVFTQDVFQDENGTGFLDTLTRTMGADVVFAVNGEILSAPNDDTIHYDFNGDGRISVADGQTLLDHVTLGTALAANEAYADISGDGTVDTYDVHLFLKLYQSAVEVPAEGSVAVDVTITLTDAEKAQLAEENPAGAYVQAFVHAKPLATAEGEILPTLGIPVLGYYGGWNEPSMFDETCYTTYYTGGESREPYWATPYVNGVGVTYGDKANVTYYFGGNPITPDAVYMPERNAINLERGDFFAGWDFGLIRNAGAHRAMVVNTTTGEELFCEEGGAVDAAYFEAALGSWVNVPQTFQMDFAPDMEEGEQGLLTFSAVVDLYAGENGVDWTKADTMEMPFVVDNTAPVITADSVVVDTENNVLRLTVTDNQHVAGVAIYDVTGRKLLASCGADQTAQPGQTLTMEVSLENVDGYKFVIQVVDYAVNKTTYKLKQTIGDPEPLPQMLYYSTTFHEWEIGDWPATTSELVSYDGWFTSEVDAVAAAAVGSYVFMMDDAQNLYAAPGDNMFELAKIRTMEHQLVDMAYDGVNGILYGLTDGGMLVSIDRMTGALTEIGTIYVGSSYYQAASLAYDGAGTFYTTRSGSYPQLYSFTLDTLGSATYLGYLDAYSYGNQTLEFNPNDGMLYYVCNHAYSGSSYELWKIDPADLDSQEYRYFYGDVTALVCPDWSEEANAWYDPNGKVSGITLNKSAAGIFVGKSVQLSANISPWNVEDRSVTFQSADTAIATVSADGLVTGVSEGTTVITAASASDPTITAECTITVSVLDITVEGVLIDADDVSRLYTWDAASGESWVGGMELPRDAIAVSQVPGEDAFFMIDPDYVTYKVDKTTGEDLADPYNYLPSTYMYPHGIAYSALFSKADAPMVYYLRNGQLSRPRDPGSSAYWTTFSLGYDHSFLAGVHAAGTEPYTYYGADYDSEIVYLVDDQGMVWRGNIFVYYGSYMIRYSKVPSTLPADVFTSGKEMSSLVLGDDGALYLSAFTGKSNTLYRLAYDEDAGVYEAMDLGSYGENVWPSLLLKVTSNADPVTAVPEAIYEAVATEEAAGSLQSIEVVEEEETVEGGIVVDRQQETITVPVTAVDSTNGLFHVDYDSEVLELLSVTPGAVLNSIDTAEAGTVRMGYADAENVNAVVATLVFGYTPADDVQTTDLVVTTLEDGDAAPADEQTVSLEIPAHEYVVTERVEPTCTEDGYQVWTCVDCGESYTEVLEATGHSHEAVVTAPTCTEGGYTTYTCACGDSYVADHTDPTGHEYESVVTDPTGTTQGYTTHTCKHCGDSYVDSYTDPVPTGPSGGNGPDTGDHAMTGLWLALVLMSVSGLTALEALRRKRSIA